MSETDFPLTRRMQPGELLHGPDTRDAWLSVVRGRVWVTQVGDPTDHFLDSGQSIRLRAGAQALVGAEGPAEVVLTAGPASTRVSPGTGGVLRGQFVG